ncbi:MAG: hypothetical protein HQL51_06895 [Magnetococcales bacterium]|nr:hypothetical protein [Magnetococcales bacterium]
MDSNSVESLVRKYQEINRLAARHLIKDLKYTEVISPFYYEEKESTDDREGISESNSSKSSEKILRQNTPKILSSLYTEIERAFNHIPEEDAIQSCYVFPKIEKMNEELRDIINRYTYDHEVYLTELKINSGVYANISHQHTEIVATSLCEMAKDITPTKKGLGRILFLVGEIGEGKSIFTDYLLSANKNLFLRNKVLPIKIDLTHNEIANQKTENIVENIYRSSIRTLFETYHPIIIKSEHIIESKDFLKLKSYYQNIIRTWISEKNLGKTQGFPLNKFRTHGIIDVLFSAVMSITQDCKHTPLFVVDGLDNYYRDIRSNSLFINKCRDLISTISDPNKDDLPYLIVTRKESFDYIDQPKDVPQFNYRYLSLLPVTACDIIAAKNNVAEELIENLSPDNFSATVVSNNIRTSAKCKQDTAKSLRKYISDLTSLINEIINHALGVTPPKDRRLALDKIFNSNNRMMIEAYKCVAKEVLNRIEIDSNTSRTASPEENMLLVTKYIIDLLTNPDKKRIFISRLHYIVIQGMMINKYHYCFPRFKIGKAENFSGGTDIGPISESSIENYSLLPNIFNVTPTEIDIEKKGFSHHFLVQVRILQYIRYIQKHHPGTGVSYKDISEKLRFFFSYNEEIVKIELRMLYANQCIRKVPKFQNYDLWKLSELGKYIVSNLMFNYNYLASAADHFEAPSKFGILFLTPARSLSLSENSAANISDYIAIFGGKVLPTKMRYAISMAAFINRIDELERQKFLSIEGFNFFNFNKEATEDDLGIGKRVTENVEQTVKIILSGNKPIIRNYALPAFENAVNEKSKITAMIFANNTCPEGSPNG